MERDNPQVAAYHQSVEIFQQPTPEMNAENGLQLLPSIRRVIKTLSGGMDEGISSRISDIQFDLHSFCGVTMTQQEIRAGMNGLQALLTIYSHAAALSSGLKEHIIEKRILTNWMPAESASFEEQALRLFTYVKTNIRYENVYDGGTKKEDENAIFIHASSREQFYWANVRIILSQLDSKSRLIITRIMEEGFKSQELTKREFSEEEVKSAQEEFRQVYFGGKKGRVKSVKGNDVFPEQKADADIPHKERSFRKIQAVTRNMSLPQFFAGVERLDPVLQRVLLKVCGYYRPHETDMKYINEQTVGGRRGFYNRLGLALGRLGDMEIVSEPTQSIATIVNALQENDPTGESFPTAGRNIKRPSARYHLIGILREKPELIDSLTDKTKEVVIVAIGQQEDGLFLTNEQVADVEGMTVSEVRNYLWRAHEKLKKDTEEVHTNTGIV